MFFFCQGFALVSENHLTLKAPHQTHFTLQCHNLESIFSPKIFLGIIPFGRMVA